MTPMQKLFNFYINASIHVALSVYCLVRVTEYYFNLPYHEALNYFIFYGTITGYNFIKYAGVAKFYHRSLTKSLRVIQLFSLVCFIALCYYALQLPKQIWWYMSPFVALTILYAIPFLAGFQKNLRGISYLKVFVVAIVWSGVTTAVPMLANGAQVSTELVLLFVQRMLFVVVLTLPFEIRDLDFDFKNVKTLPHKIGVELTKKLGLFLLLITLVLEFLLTESLLNRKVFLGVCVLMLFFLMRTKKQQSKYYSSFWVESIPIVWFVSLLILDFLSR